MSSISNLIILTATVKPQVRQGLRRTNPELRLMDYVVAVERTLKQVKRIDAEVLLLENSDCIDLIAHTLSDRSVNSNKLHFLSCPLDVSSESDGISSGEHSMLRYAATNFELLSYDFIWKLTGRLWIQNLEQIILKSSGDMRANTFFSQHHSCDSRFFGMKSEVFCRFAKTNPSYGKSGLFDYDQATESKYEAMEYFLAHFLLRAESAGYTFKSLNKIPMYRGVSGSTGKVLDNVWVRLKIALANKMRNLLRKGLLGVNP